MKILEFKEERTPTKENADLIGTLEAFLDSDFKRVSIKWTGHYATACSCRNSLVGCAKRLMLLSLLRFYISGDKVLIEKN